MVVRVGIFEEVGEPFVEGKLLLVGFCIQPSRQLGVFRALKGEEDGIGTEFTRIRLDRVDLPARDRIPETP